MKSSSFDSLSSPSPPAPVIPKSQKRSNFFIANQSNLPAVIPLDYDYSKMAPSTVLRSQINDNTRYHSFASRTHQHGLAINDERVFENSSLFGDPIYPPPPEEFRCSTLQTSSFIRTQENNTSSEENHDQYSCTLAKKCKRLPGESRLLSQVSYTTAPLQTPCGLYETDGANTSNQRSSMNRGFSNDIPRLKPPEIQILPNSSNGSSAESNQSPNFVYPQFHDNVSSQKSKEIESVIKNDIATTFEPSNATLDDGLPTHIISTNNNNNKPSKIPMRRQFSNESYSSGEWLRSSVYEYSDFTKMPKLRPSSKNVLSIKRDEMPLDSPVAAMINESTGSSSGEERLREMTQLLNKPQTLKKKEGFENKIPSASISCLSSKNESLTPREFLKQQQKCVTPKDENLQSISPKERELQILPKYENVDETKKLSRVPSPVIFKQSITTGGDFRVEQGRFHKKTSFTIMRDKSPPSSCAESPRLDDPYNVETKPAKQAPPKVNIYLNQKSLSSSQLKLPRLLQLAAASPRPSVQFNISSELSTDKLPNEKDVLQYSDSLGTALETLPHQHQRNNSLPYIINDLHRKTQSTSKESLYKNTRTTSIPRIYRPDLKPEIAVIPPGAVAHPIKTNLNPTRKQKGLLKVLNNDECLPPISSSSNWKSMDDMFLEHKHKSSGSLHIKNRRRSSSTSPSRRSSTVTTSDRRSSNLSLVTTSDFSFQGPFVTSKQTRHNTQRRKSVFQFLNHISKTKPVITFNKTALRQRKSRSKVAKPTTLSPILGTPNKEGHTPQRSKLKQNQSAKNTDVISDFTSTITFPVKVPIRSRKNSISISQPSLREDSQMTSQASSLFEELRKQVSPTISKSTDKSFSQSSLKAISKSSSKSNSRTNSKTNSRVQSRSSSRASTQIISMSDYRPESHLELPSTETNSRKSLLTSTVRGGSVSPRLEQKSLTKKANAQERRKSSFSDAEVRLRKSIVKGSKNTFLLRVKPNNKSKNKSQSHNERRNSHSRIPISNRINRSNSPPKRKSSLDTGLKRTSSLKINLRNINKRISSSRKSKSTKENITSDETPIPSKVKRVISKLNMKSKNLNVKNATNIRERKETSNRNKKLAVSTPGSAKFNKDSSITARILGKNAGKQTVIAKKAMRKSTIASANSNTKRERVLKVNPTENVKETDKNGRKVGTTFSGATSTNTVAVANQDLKKEPSAASLVRASSRLSMLSKKRSESNLSKQMIEDINAEIAMLENDSGRTSRLSGIEGISNVPAAILEQSQKTLETVQKTVVEATDEIKKTINENLTDLKSFEQDMSRIPDSGEIISPATVVEKKSDQNKDSNIHNSLSRQGTAEGLNVRINDKPNRISPGPLTQPIEATVSILNADQKNTTSLTLSDDPPLANKGQAILPSHRVSERDISVMAEVDSESANFQDYQVVKATDGTITALHLGDSGGTTSTVEQPFGTSTNFEAEAKRRSPDGQGGSNTPSSVDAYATHSTSSQDNIKANPLTDTGVSESDSSKTCCHCCPRLCLPCRRSRCSRCCRSQGTDRTQLTDETEESVLSATSSTTTTHLEVIDEKSITASSEKPSFWQKLRCCKICYKKQTMTQLQSPNKELNMAPPKRQLCGLCLSKIFCCRSVNKIDPKTGDETEVKKCCFCIPCRKKHENRDRNVNGSSSADGSTTIAWHDTEAGMGATDANADLQNTQNIIEPKDGCCKRVCNVLLCCRKKPPLTVEERRRSSIKQPTEDTRQRLHVDLVEYNSKMKAAIPILPLWLAWLCAFCNVFIPGFGTLLSGFLCICIGIPRFSQFDSAKARVGSLIINIIVAVSQLFCVLFCFVGWGWSIWWATIMLKVAKKLSKIRKIERMEVEEEKRQAALAAAAAKLPAANEN